MLQDLSEILVVTGAVPPPGPELVLALPHRHLGALGHLVNDLRFRLAQLGLFASQALGFPADAVGVHHQGAANCPAKLVKEKKREEKISGGEWTVHLGAAVTQSPACYNHMTQCSLQCYSTEVLAKGPTISAAGETAPPAVRFPPRPETPPRPSSAEGKSTTK